MDIAALQTITSTVSVVKDEKNTQTAIFAAGCFWGVQEEFDEVYGVISTNVGYTGGRTENPTYQNVCAGLTGHAEAVKVIFDPLLVSYDRLLELFWKMHDPTQLNRQVGDVGDQYRSAIFFTTDCQREVAEASKKALDASGRYRKSIVTEITAAPMFWEAEEYHQHYHRKNGGGCGF